MLTAFWDNLIYKNWLLAQFSELDVDIILLLKIKTYEIGRIRTFIPPPIDHVEKLIGTHIEHNDIIIKIELYPDDVFRPTDSFEIDRDKGKIFYTYHHNFNPDYLNSAFRYITLTFDWKESNINIDNLLIDNAHIYDKILYFGLDEYITYPKAKYITFY